MRSESNWGLDWDATVRQAFLEACMLEGVRAELARVALRYEGPCADATLRKASEDAARRAALGWLTIETSLEQYGELAALALERCIEEAALQIRRGSSFPPPLVGTSSRPTSHRRGDAVALAIIERGRQRLSRFRHRDGAASVLPG